MHIVRCGVLMPSESATNQLEDIPGLLNILKSADGLRTLRAKGGSELDNTGVSRLYIKGGIFVVVCQVGTQSGGCNMWFRRGHRPKREPARDELKLGTSLVKTGVNGSAALPPVSYYVDNAPNTRPPSAEATVPTGPMELRARHTHLKQFEPGQRRLARNLVIGAGASNQVYSSYN